MALLLGGQRLGNRLVEIGGDLVEIAMAHPPVQPRPVDVDDQADAVVQRHREGLRTAHPAAAAGQRQRAGQGAAEAFGRHGREGLIGALHDALGADVDPRAGGHLAVHGQSEPLQPAELRPGRPVADQVGVGDDHPRCPLVGAHHADRPARLDQHGLVRRQRRQGANHRVERAPVPRRPSGPAVHDQVVGALGDLRVEVVHQHPQRRFGGPAAGGQRGAARGAYGSGAFHDHPFSMLCPEPVEGRFS